MKRRWLATPVLLLPLALLTACGGDSVSPNPPTPSPTASPEPQENEAEKPTDSADASLIPFSEAPSSLTTSDLTSTEISYLEEMKKIKLHPSLKPGSDKDGFFENYGADESLSVSVSTINGKPYISALAEDGSGVKWDGEEEKTHIVRTYSVSPETQAYVDLLVPAITAWHKETGEWPSAGWDLMEDKWVVEPGSFDESKKKPVELNLPETFDDNGYSLMGDEGYFDFMNETNGESVRLYFTGEDFDHAVSSTDIPLS